MLTGHGHEILRRLSDDMTIEHLKEMEDLELQRLTEQLWRWHDEALREPGGELLDSGEPVEVSA